MTETEDSKQDTCDAVGLVLKVAAKNGIAHTQNDNGEIVLVATAKQLVNFTYAIGHAAQMHVVERMLLPIDVAS